MLKIGKETMVKTNGKHIHIPTNWGVAVLLVLLIGVLVSVTQINQIQNLSSHAAVPTPRPTSRPTPKPTAVPVSKCVSQLHGKCQYTSQKCSKHWASGYCPGASNYKCCY